MCISCAHRVADVANTLGFDDGTQHALYFGMRRLGPSLIALVLIATVALFLAKWFGWLSLFIFTGLSAILILARVFNIELFGV